MSGPRIDHVEGLGETIGNTLSGIANTLQQAQQQRMQQQQEALKTILTQAQLEHTQAETQQTQTLTAGERQTQREQQKKDERDEAIRTGTQRMLGTIIPVLAAGKRPGDPEYDLAWANALRDEKDPDVIHNALLRRDEVAKMFESESHAQTAGTEATVAQAQAPAKTAEARALDTWHTQHPGTPIEVGLVQLRASLERRGAQATGDAQADMAQRQMVLGALGAARKAKDAFDAVHSTGRQPLSFYLDQQAQSIIDPTTGAPMRGDVLARQAGQMVRGIPKIAAPTGQARSDAAAIRKALPALRRAGFDEEGIVNFYKDNGYSRAALQAALVPVSHAGQ